MIVAAFLMCDGGEFQTNYNNINGCSAGVQEGEGRHPPGSGTVDSATSSLSEMTIGEATASSNIPARGATSLPNRDQQDSTQSKGNRSYADTVSQGSPVDTLSPCSLTEPLSPCSPTDTLEKEVTAASQDVNAKNSDVEGLETMQEVEAEGIAVDDKSVQRMMGLLAAQQDSKKSRVIEVGIAVSDVSRTGEEKNPHPFIHLLIRLV